MFDSTLGRGDFTKDLLTLFTLVNYQVAHKYTNTDTQIHKYKYRHHSREGGAREELKAGWIEADS